MYAMQQLICYLIQATGFFSCFDIFLVLWLCLVDPVQHCDHLVRELVALLFFGLRRVYYVSGFVCSFS